MSNVQPPEKTALPANRAFIVQFAPAKGDGSLVFKGRIEHIVSGQVAIFSNESELQEFIQKLLSDD